MPKCIINASSLKSWLSKDELSITLNSENTVMCPLKLNVNNDPNRKPGTAGIIVSPIYIIEYLSNVQYLSKFIFFANKIRNEVFNTTLCIVVFVLFCIHLFRKFMILFVTVLL